MVGDLRRLCVFGGLRRRPAGAHGVVRDGLHRAEALFQGHHIGCRRRLFRHGRPRVSLHLSSSVSLPHPLNPIPDACTRARALAPRTRACAWRGSDMRLRLGARGYAVLLTRASADMHARARAPCSCVFSTGNSGCTTTGWRACRRPSSPASRASGMSRSLSPRPHTLARTRNGTCSALPSSAFPVASLAFLPPFLCTALSYADSSIRMRHGFLLRVCVCCVDVRP